jgi:ApbE superfamily uncharacterized protein (UPF0280 family)
MTVAVLRNGHPSSRLARDGAEKAIEILDDLAQWIGVIKLSSTKIKKFQNLPAILQRMIRSTQQMGDSGLTPLAAVAGAVSDEVADFLKARGGYRVIVNNGGDIALRLRERETVRVGIRLDVQTKGCPHRLIVDGKASIDGIATSGLGGRSFTKGVASAAVSIASSAAHADVGATVLANSTAIEDPNVETERAEKIYPDTDIPGQYVVTRVGEIGERKIAEALENGLRTASRLVEKGLIKGAIIAVKGRVRWTPNLEVRGRDFYVKG